MSIASVSSRRLLPVQNPRRSSWRLARDRLHSIRFLRRLLHVPFLLFHFLANRLVQIVEALRFLAGYRVLSSRANERGLTRKNLYRHKSKWKRKIDPREKATYLIEHCLRRADEAPPCRASSLRHTDVENLTVILHVGVISVDPVVAGEIVHDILSNERRVVRQF